MINLRGLNASFSGNLPDVKYKDTAKLPFGVKETPIGQDKFENNLNKPSEKSGESEIFLLFRKCIEKLKDENPVENNRKLKEFVETRMHHYMNKNVFSKEERAVAIPEFLKYTKPEDQQGINAICEVISDQLIDVEPEDRLGVIETISDYIYADPKKPEEAEKAMYAYGNLALSVLLYPPIASDLKKASSIIAKNACRLKYDK